MFENKLFDQFYHSAVIFKPLSLFFSLLITQGLGKRQLVQLLRNSILKNHKCQILLCFLIFFKTILSSPSSSCTVVARDDVVEFREVFVVNFFITRFKLPGEPSQRPMKMSLFCFEVRLYRTSRQSSFHGP